jgi:hypothetical protein
VSWTCGPVRDKRNAYGILRGYLWKVEYVGNGEIILRHLKWFLRMGSGGSCSRLWPSEDFGCVRTWGGGGEHSCFLRTA